jgi:hypothetical protein
VLVRNEVGERERVRAVLKRELGRVGRQRGRGSRRACALVHGGSRGSGADRAVPWRSERKQVHGGNGSAR